MCYPCPTPVLCYPCPVVPLSCGTPVLWYPCPVVPLSCVTPVLWYPCPVVPRLHVLSMYFLYNLRFTFRCYICAVIFHSGVSLNFSLPICQHYECQFTNRQCQIQSQTCQFTNRQCQSQTCQLSNCHTFYHLFTQCQSDVLI